MVGRAWMLQQVWPRSFLGASVTPLQDLAQNPPICGADRIHPNPLGYEGTAFLALFHLPDISLSGFELMASSDKPTNFSLANRLSSRTKPKLEPIFVSQIV